jgi:hypothetical protein
MTFAFNQATRLYTPIIAGIAGPSKSGKTFSALRVAVGLANGGKIAMINTEGPNGHQYAELFKYDICDFPAPFSMKRYTEAIKDVASIHPAVVIIDSMSHAHEGQGGLLDQHESELDRMAGNDFKKRDRMTWAAWVKPKADETEMINSLLQVDFHLILCFRAKEKIKIVKGKDPVDLGWRPIASDRIHFETAFTLILPPNSKGTPDMTSEGSELRNPFDKMVQAKQLDENLGKQLLEWAKGGVTKQPSSKPEDIAAETKAFTEKCIEVGMSTAEIAGMKKHIWKQAPTKAELQWVIGSFTDWFDEFIEAQKAA